MENERQQYIDAAWQHLDQLTKPPRSLGRLEEIAAQLCGIQKTNCPQTKPRSVIIFAGDHGFCEEGVSAFPQAVTVEMMRNMANGGAAVNVLSKLHDANLRIIDVGSLLGMNESIQGIEQRLIRNGTRNFSTEPAMTVDEMQTAMETGRSIVNEEVDKGMRLLIFGEMGIGNTTSAAAISAAVMNRNAEEVTGYGTGVGESGLQRKLNVVKRALSLYQYNNANDILRCLGGYEIAAMTGAMIETSQHNIPILLDGYIVSTSALVACEFEPSVKHNLIASHCSAEKGHRLILDYLQVKPLLDFSLKLGEASGALIALPVLDSAAAIFNEMATFETANISSQSS